MWTSRDKRSRTRRRRQSGSETLAGSAFLAHAVSYQPGNIINTKHFGRYRRNMPCFVTSWCEAKQAKLRRFSAAPLNRGLRNVTWQNVFRQWLLTLFQTHYKYKHFSIHKETLTLFSNVSLLRVAEWSRVEWSALECSRGH